jgi:hypothetical protein
MIAKKPREVSRNVESQPRADLGNVDIIVYNGINRPFQPHNVEVDAWRNADRGFEQTKEMRAR